jgi:hypothetical protein
VEYGGSEIASSAGAAQGSGADEFEDLPVTSDDHGATGD